VIFDWDFGIGGLPIGLSIADCRLDWRLPIADWIADCRLPIALRSSCEPVCRSALHLLRFQTALMLVLLGNCGGARLALLAGMRPQAEALQRRAHDFFVNVIRLCNALPKIAAADSIAEQLLDSAGSTDSNYGAACKARSRKLFVDKLGIAAEEADESLRWLQALCDANLGDANEVRGLVKEADELTAIFTASHKTAKARLEAEEARAAAEKELKRRRR
jgi:four helix bundle protein